MSEFKSLSEAIAEWVKHSLDELPTKLKKWVESAFIASWDGLTDEQRLSVANQWDAQHDPANEEARQYWWDFFARRQELENDITKWEAIPNPTIPTEMATQQSHLESLNQRRLAMEEEYQAAISQEAAGYQPTAENESPEQRKQRLEAWHMEEKPKGRGALNRTAEREGITRQTLQGILNRP